MKSFYSYMKQYKNIDCPGRDLYEDMTRDDAFPKNETSRYKILLYLQSIMACDAAIDAFENYWLEYAHDCDINITSLDCKKYLDQVIESLRNGDWHDLDDAVDDLEKISYLLDESV